MMFLTRRDDPLVHPSKTRVERMQPLLPSDPLYLLSPGDVHLGGKNRGAALFEILSGATCDVLVLNGDFLDVDSLTLLLKRLDEADRALINLIEEKRRAGTRVVYARGNHDEEVERLLADVEEMRARRAHAEGTMEHAVLEALALINNWERTTMFVHDYQGKRYAHAHGDQWDYIVHGGFFGKLVAAVGAYLWEVLKRIGGERQRIAMFAKRRVKLWTRIADLVANGVVDLAREHGAHYALAGHTHDLRESSHDGITYVNAGSFDMYESGLVSIDRDGTVTLHHIRARTTPIEKTEG